NKNKINELNEKLIKEIKNKNKNIILTIPEILNWDDISYFIYPRTRKKKEAIIDIDIYFNNINKNKLSIDSIKQNDKIYGFDENNNQYFCKSVYKCMYYEIKEKNLNYILFSGKWYEVNNIFLGKIDLILKNIKKSNINFPSINTWIEDNKRKIEKEKDYNKKVAHTLDIHLLDAILVKSFTTTEPIEICDLLTNDKQLIHAKHRKGGSSSLSHLFAQGKISAETLLGDNEFRVATHEKLKEKAAGSEEIISVKDFRADDYEIIYLVLGEDTSQVVKNLPFFSRVNLARTYQSLTALGFKVSIAGAKKNALA